MGGWIRAGRVDLPTLLSALLGAALGAVVVALLVPAREARALPPPPAESSALAAAIEKLDQRLARIEASMAVQDSRGTRGEVKQSSAAPSSASNESAPKESSTMAGADELHADLLQISKRIDLLAGSLKENHKPAFSMPTLEQIHAARRDIDWAFLEPLRALAISDPDAASQRVRGMTFDEVLKKVGVPLMISDEHGQWNYYRTQPNDFGEPQQRGISFWFVGDTVSQVYRIN